MDEISYQALQNANNYREISQLDKKWIPFNMRSKINPLRIFAICANQITMQFIWTPLGVLTKPYCMKLGLSHYATTLVLMTGNFIGFIVPPLIASISDSTTLKFGRRRIFLIIGEILVIIGYLMISFCREMSIKFSLFNVQQTKSLDVQNDNYHAILYFIIGQIMTYLGGNVANGPGRAMCSDVVPPTQQVLVSNICVFDAAIAGVISNSIGAFKLYKYTNLSNETFVLIVSCGIGFFALLISVIFTPEEKLSKKPKKTNPIRQVIESFHSIDKDLLNILIAFFFYQIGTTEFSIQGSNYIAMYIFGGQPNGADGLYDAGISYAQLLCLLQTILQLIYSVFNTKVVNRFGFKFAWLIATVSLFFANLLFYLIPNKYFLIIPYALFGISCVIGFSLPFAYISLVAPSEKLAGFMTLIILFGNIGGILVMFILTMYIGSFQMFLDNPGRLVGVSVIFAVVALLFGNKGYHEYMEKLEA